MTKKELIELSEIFTKLAGFGKTKFKYAMLKNIDAIKSEVSILLDLENSIKKHIAKFDEERNDLILRIGKKREDGAVYIDLAQEEMVDLFNAGLKLLLETHAENLSLYKTKMNEYSEILKEEVGYTFVYKTIFIDDLPEENISIDQLAILEKYGIIIE